MLLSVNDTLGYRIQAVDDDVGTLDDLLFERATSRIRYLVIDAGSWLTDRVVLLPPAAFGTMQPGERRIPTALTKQQVKDSPPMQTALTLSRSEEELLHSYYGWTPYWEATLPTDGLAPGYWGVLPPESATMPPEAPAGAAPAEPPLRSAKELIGHYVQATDGEIGHLSDLLIDEHDWTIRLLVIDTRNWWPGKKVVIAPDWLEQVDWMGHQITVGLTREQIKGSPEYDPARTLDRSYQEHLYRHYGRKPYWS